MSVQHQRRTKSTRREHNRLLALQLLHVIAVVSMSFQRDEQEFDFSYMFEYNQDVQDEAKVGELPSANTYFLDYMLCVMQ